MIIIMMMRIIIINHIDNDNINRKDNIMSYDNDNHYEYISVCYSIFQSVTVYFSMLRCISVCSSIFQYVAVYFSMSQ